MSEDRDQLRVVGAAGGLGDLWWSFVLRGVLAAVLGLGALIWPSVTLAVLIALVGVYCLADGVAGLVGALRTSDRGAHLLQALLGIVVGAVLLFWPGASVRTLLIVFGAWALFTGVSQILAARRADVEADARSLMTTLGGITAAVGLILIIWPGSGVVAISWLIALAALLLAALLIFMGLRLKRLQDRMATIAGQPR